MSLRVWLPLNGDLRNQGLDGNVAVTNNGAVVNNSGKTGACYSFGTAKSYFKFNDVSFMHSFTECSITLWLKIISWNTSYATYFQFGLGSTPWTNYIFSLLRDNATSKLCFSIARGSSSSKTSCSTPELQLNTWYHLSLIYSSGHCKIYINGIEITDLSTTIVPNFAGITTGIIGACNNGNSYQTNCLLNDFRIYDHALSEKEVKEIAKGLILHYKLEDQKCGIYPNLIQSSKTTFHSTQEWTGTGWASSFMAHDDLMAFLKPSTTYTFSWDGEIVKRTSVPTKYSLQMGFLFYSASNGSANRASQKNNQTEAGVKHHVSTTFVTPSVIPDDYRIIYYTNRYTTNGSSPVGFDTVKFSNIKLEEHDSETQYILSDSELNINSNIIEDCSGYSHNGQIVSNINISSDTMKYNTSALFDGVDDCIIVPYNAICPENIFTINLWFKKDALGSKNYETLFGGPSGFEMDTRSGSSTALSLYMASTRGGNMATGLQLNTWYMVTMVRDGINERYYINGELKKEIAAKAMPTGVYRIGAWASDTKQNYYGNISDFRIYCTTLSADDIKELYQTSASIDDKQNFYSRELSNSLHDTTSITQAGIALADDFVEDAVAAIKDDRSIESNCFYEY